METKNYSSMPTRELLKELARLRSYIWREFDYEDYVTPARVVRDALKEELAKRPHVPRRLEVKRNRQKMAKMYRGQGKSKNR